MSPRKETTESVKESTKSSISTRGFTAEEKAAMRERIKEERAAGTAAEAESAVLARIAEMVEPDRSMAKRIHAIVKETAPSLTSRLWYGMPAYGREGKIICWFQDAAKFKARYATFSFSDGAKLDEGAMWPISYALMELTPAAEAKLRALVKKAVG